MGDPRSGAPPSDVAAWAATFVGAATWQPVTAVQARVWRGPGCWLKLHREPGAARREALALEVAASVPGTVPLLAHHGCALLLGHVDGAPPTRGQPAAWRAVGRWLAALHALPTPPADLLPLREALGRRAAGWSARGRHPRADAVVALVSALPDLPTRRVWCHRDVQAHNLRWTDGRVGVIDLGQARPDLDLVDVVKLLELPDVLTGPDRAALWDGLGGPPADAAALLRALTALHGLATATWASRHGDAALAARGEAILAHALEQTDWRWCLR